MTDEKTNAYEIANRHSGHVLGIYEGRTPEDALDALARDAGYQDAKDARAQVGDHDDLIVLIHEQYDVA